MEKRILCDGRQPVCLECSKKQQKCVYRPAPVVTVEITQILSLRGSLGSVPTDVETYIIHLLSATPTLEITALNEYKFIGCIFCSDLALGLQMFKNSNHSTYAKTVYKLFHQLVPEIVALNESQKILLLDHMHQSVIYWIMELDFLKAKSLVWLSKFIIDNTRGIIIPKVRETIQYGMQIFSCQNNEERFDYLQIILNSNLAEVKIPYLILTVFLVIADGSDPTKGIRPLPTPFYEKVDLLINYIDPQIPQCIPEYQALYLILRTIVKHHQNPHSWTNDIQNAINILIHCPVLGPTGYWAAALCTSFSLTKPGWVDYVSSCQKVLKKWPYYYCLWESLWKESLKELGLFEGSNEDG